MFSTLADGATWGVPGPTFLLGFGVVCLAGIANLGGEWYRRLVSDAEREEVVPEPDLDLYELAMLSGGPSLAVTSAAAQLHRDGIIKHRVTAGTFEVVGELDEIPDPIELAIVETVTALPDTQAEELREAAANTPAVQGMRTHLENSGLLLSEEASSALFWRTLCLGGGLALFGLARLVFGLVNHEPVGYLVLIDAVLLIGTVCLIGAIPLTTLRGRAALKRERRDHESLKLDPASGGNAVLAAALFGGAALWLAEPEFAHAFAIPREPAPGTGGGGGGGGDGGGGCGGGCGG